ncbi:hypothetical protein T492DRAFT_885430 [Pavlovales sp. CCMP2436]|nr:hypothetical protein T492DRAFT_885430 [Pavlovales sp. CCMP2436]
MKLARPPEFQDVAGLVDVASAGRAFPRPPGVALSYGVAGFRARAPLLESTLLRMGMLAARRSAVMGYAVGLMVTASHNAEPDNGVKLVDVDGGMLHQSWEAYAAALANADDGDLTSALAKLPGGSGAPGGAAERPSVLIAWDTRPSSERLAALAMRGAQLAGAQALTLGLLTTPQLHHIVRMSNGAAGCAAVGSRWGLPEWASEAGYYEMLAGAYAELVGVGERGAPAAVASPLDVDCACGIGAPAVERLAAALTAKLGAGAPALRVVNAPGSGELNTGCGAEHVQKAREPPRGLESVQAMVAGRAASLDGDADRIVFHYFTHAGGWALLDGDKIAALVAGFLREQLRSALRGHTAPAASAPPRATPSTAARPPRARSEEDEEEADGSELRAAVVQTAYANGASSAYLLGLGVEIAAAKTGVKFLHTQVWVWP